MPQRQIHLDFHTSPLIPDVGARFDAALFASTLKQAGVQSINLFAKCHHGLYYYPTRLGRIHPGLPFDLLGRQIEACRHSGVGVRVYTCVAWAEDVADRNPGWLQVNAAGVAGIRRPFTAGFSSWRTMCLAEPGLIQLIKAEIAEVQQRYQPDGYWIDIVIQFGCICTRCLAEMRSLGVDPTDPAQVARHDRMVEIRFAREIFEFARTLDPTLEVFFNGFAYEMDLVDQPDLSAAQKRRWVTYLDVESLPSDDWGYAHFPVIANYLDTADRTTPFTMMNGKFHTSWGDFGSLRNVEALEYECFRAAAAGAGSCVGDQLHPSGALEPSVYERIGQVFSQLAQRQPWLTGTRKVSEVAVLADAPVLGAGIRERMGGNPSAEGAYRMLSETHRLFDFLDFTDDLSRYSLVILADGVQVDDSMAARLDAYVAAGGGLLLTGRSGLDLEGKRFALRCAGVCYVGEAAFRPRYARISRDAFPDILPMDYVLYEQGVSVAAEPGSRVIAPIVNPYFNRTWEHFCSHRQTPPAQVSEEPFLVRTDRVAYVAHPLFTDYAVSGCRVYRDIARQLIVELAGDPLIITDLPTTAELTLRTQGENLILHALHYIIQRKCRTLETVEEKIPLLDRSFALRTASAPRRVYLAPQGQDLAFHYHGGRCKFTVPRIDGYQIVVLEMASPD